jgi:ABC-2 type transport system permease protein
MNTSPNNTPEPAGVSSSAEASAKADDPGYSSAGPAYQSSSTQPFYWSVRRELWENRSIYVAPLIVAVVVLFGFLISTIGMPERRQGVLLLDPAHQRAIIGMPYDVAAMMLIFTAFIVGVFYCFDALHSERRDRSILFWKSLPVSDLTTVLSKATVPFVILPLIIFGTVVLVQFLMLLWSSAILLPSGLAATTWTRFNLFQQSVILLYSLIVIALWHAPVYGWALLISGWARRATFLWAVLPLLAIGVLEKFAFDTSYFVSMLKDRLFGAGDTAFAFQPHRGVAIDSLVQLTPGRFLATPGLWIGLAFAAAFVAIAVRQRRYRGPI